MKLILILISAFIVSISTYSQSAIIQEENKLWIPAEPETNRFTITKADIQKVEFVSSELGEVKGYTIKFKMGSILYIKDMTDNSFNPFAKKKYLESGAGTILYLDMIIKDAKKDTILKPRYEFVLTFD